MQSEQSDLGTSFKYLPQVKILMKFRFKCIKKGNLIFNLLNLSYPDLGHSEWPISLSI